MRILLALVLAGCAGQGATPDDDDDDDARDGAVVDAPGPTLDGGLVVPERGAAVPWITYEAEDGVTNAQVVGPSRALGTPAGEASGRRAVILGATGHFVQWTTEAAANAIVVRHSIPDAPGGGGTRATLGLYVNGSRRATLALSSKEAWIYGGDATQSNAPSAGPPRRIYSEASLLLDVTIAAGAEVRLQRDASDTAPSYAIDFIELEQVAPPLPAPAAFLSITEAGHGWAPAIPDDGLPDDDAITRCLQAAMAGQYAGVYLPPGRFDQLHKLEVAGTTVAGAGIWHTRLHNGDLSEDPGPGQTGFVITGDRAHFRDFAIFGSTDGLRTQGGKAWVGAAFDDTVIERMWVENVQCGYWVGGAGPSNRLQIRHSRFRNTGADAINLCNGSRDSVVEHNHARHTGDDAFAIWSATDLYPHPATGNVIRHCTAQLPWRAAGFAIYGGADNRIEDSVAVDTLTYPGLTVSSEFAPYPLESATVAGLSLIRAGGTYWGGQQFGAIWLRADHDPIAGVTLRDIDIVDPTYQGIQVQGDGGGMLRDVLIERVTITRPTTYGIQVLAGATGAATFRDVIVTEPGVAAVANQSGGSFTIEDGGGNRW